MPGGAEDQPKPAATRATPADASNATHASATTIVGIDVGGTFTDLVAWREADRSLRLVKVPSTPPDFERGVCEALARLNDANVRSIVHGSTVATNALLERRGELIAFITTEG